MKKIDISIIFNIMMLIFLLATFYWQYEYLLVTRIILIVFTLFHLLFEVKKDYFSRRKTIFIIFSVISIIALIISILIDNSSPNNVINNRDYLIPVFVIILIASMYKELYDKNR